MLPCDLSTSQKRLFPDCEDQDKFRVGRLHSTGGLTLSCLSLSPSPWQWLRNPGPQHEKRTLFGDMVCFLFITPLATISGWLCLRGAVDHLHFSSRLEAVGLIALTVALFTIYLFWTLVSMARPRRPGQPKLAAPQLAWPPLLSGSHLTCPVQAARVCDLVCYYQRGRGAGEGKGGVSRHTLLRRADQVKKKPQLLRAHQSETHTWTLLSSAIEAPCVRRRPPSLAYVPHFCGDHSRW